MKDSQYILLNIDEDTAENIRDWASEELQRKGFDVNCELTDEGKILESLVDSFYLG